VCLDAGRYMEFDGITAKHLYRFFAVAFEKTDLIVMDARKLAMEHVGILNSAALFLTPHADPGAGVRSIDQDPGTWALIT
jgi:hypothetical protein